MGPDFTTRPEGDRPFIPIFTMRAAENWTSHDAGLGSLQFARRGPGFSYVTYARIADVPTGCEGRSIAVWILAHPWRIISAARMVHAYARLVAARSAR